MDLGRPLQLVSGRGQRDQLGLAVHSGSAVAAGCGDSAAAAAASVACEGEREREGQKAAASLWPCWSAHGACWRGWRRLRGILGRWLYYHLLRVHLMMAT
jgi:hypothetical protein